MKKKVNEELLQRNKAKKFQRFIQHLITCGLDEKINKGVEFKLETEFREKEMKIRPTFFYTEKY